LVSLWGMRIFFVRAMFPMPETRHSPSSVMAGTAEIRHVSRRFCHRRDVAAYPTSGNRATPSGSTADQASPRRQRHISRSRPVAVRRHIHTGSLNGGKRTFPIARAEGIALLCKTRLGMREDRSAARTADSVRKSVSEAVGRVIQSGDQTKHAGRAALAP